MYPGPDLLCPAVSLLWPQPPFCPQTPSALGAGEMRWGLMPEGLHVWPKGRVRGTRSCSPALALHGGTTHGVTPLGSREEEPVF